MSECEHPNCAYVNISSENVCFRWISSNSISSFTISFLLGFFFNEKKKCFFFRVEIQNRKYHYFIINCARDPAETNIKHNNRAVAVLVAATAAAAATAVFSYAQPVHVHKITAEQVHGTPFAPTNRPTDRSNEIKSERLQ